MYLFVQNGIPSIHILGDDAISRHQESKLDPIHPSSAKEEQTLVPCVFCPKRGNCTARSGVDRVSWTHVSLG